jgi:DNA-binding response OmpR family regulator
MGQTDDTLRPLVLVVTADDHKRVLLGEYLTNVGYGVFTVPGIETIAPTLKDKRPYAVAIDNQVAAGCGVQGLRELRSRIPARVPIVLFSLPVEGSFRFGLFSEQSPSPEPARPRLVDAIRPSHQPLGKEVKKVLVVDDEPAVSELLARALLDKGFQVIQAFDGSKGLESAVRCHPDVIVLDLSLPEYDGVQVMERLRSDPATSDIPVLIHTGTTLNEEERQKLAGHAYSITSKTDRESLLADLQRLDETSLSTVEL